MRVLSLLINTLSGPVFGLFLAVVAAVAAIFSVLVGIGLLCAIMVCATRWMSRYVYCRLRYERSETTAYVNWMTRGRRGQRALIEFGDQRMEVPAEGLSPSATFRVVRWGPLVSCETRTGKVWDYLPQSQN